MAKTNAERQRAYRAARATAGQDGQRRLSGWVDTGTALALSRLAKRYGVTKQEMVARLVAKADDAILAIIEPDSPEWSEYMGVRSVTL